jgi:DNA-binding FrmR family transcriptional regulator
MGHTIRDKRKLLGRVKRLRGQVEAVERALEAEKSCSEVLQLIAAARGAASALMSEVLEEHIRNHVVDPEIRPTSPKARAAEELVDVVRSYLR